MTDLDDLTRRSEVWRPVYGYEGVYEVSSVGRVRRIAAGQGAIVGIRKTARHPHGYRSVSLSRGNVQETKRVARLVLEAFVGPCPDGMEACHYNDIPDDDRIENLRWDTHRANIDDRTRNARPRRAQIPRAECSKGHPYIDGSYQVYRHGRVCIQCAKDRSRARAARKRKGLSREELLEVCRRGHPRTPANTYTDPRGKQHCRECRAAQEAKRDKERANKMARERYARGVAATRGRMHARAQTCPSQANDMREADPDPTLRPGFVRVELIFEEIS